jgi:hypothetical protein
MNVMFKDLLLIILGVASCYAYFYWKEYKEIKKQERLNQIK